MLGFKNILNREAVNTKRQLEVDIVRGLAIIFMIMVHASSCYLDEVKSDTLYARIIDFFGCIPAAPVFMFVMGIGFVYTKNQNSMLFIKRGIKIFLLGYLLNLLRGFIPNLIGSILGYYSLTDDGMAWYYYIVEVDILQFAGLAMIFIGILKRFRVPIGVYPLLGTLIGFLAPYLWGKSTGVVVVDLLLANIFGGYTYTFHPFFSWMFYPLLGMFFGWFIMRAKDKNLFYKFVRNVAFLILLGVLFYYLKYPGYDFGIVTGDVYNYFHHGLLSNYAFGALIMIWLSLWYSLGKIIPDKIKNQLYFLSSNVTAIYFIHWIILGWSSALFIESLGIVGTSVAIILIYFVTCRIVYMINIIKKNNKEMAKSNINNLSVPEDN